MERVGRPASGRAGRSCGLIAVGLLLASCGGDDGRAATATTTPSPATAETATRSTLPVTDLNVDEEAPASLREAFEWSDLVVVAEIAGETGGARFYGQSAEDPDPNAPVYEDVELELVVTSWLKGEPREPLVIRWPGYAGDGTIEGRTSTLRVGGVVLDPAHATGTYLFLLKDHGEPWGLGVTALSTGVAEVVDGKLGGQMSHGLEPERGTPTADLSPPEG